MNWLPRILICLFTFSNTTRSTFPCIPYMVVLSSAASCSSPPSPSPSPPSPPSPSPYPPSPPSPPSPPPPSPPSPPSPPRDCPFCCDREAAAAAAAATRPVAYASRQRRASSRDLLATKHDKMPHAKTDIGHRAYAGCRVTFHAPFISSTRF